MNEVKPLFDKNNETIYIATEANVKPMYTTPQKREYRSEIVDHNYKRSMIEEVIEEKHRLTYKELKDILNSMSDKDLEEEVSVEYKAYCKDGKDWYHEWTDAVSYELIHTKSDHEFYNNRKYLKLYLKSYSSKTNKEKL